MKHYRNRYHRITADQLSAGLDEVDMSIDEFCLVSGVARRRMMQWLHGEEEPAPHVPVLLALMTLPGGKELALTVAERFLISEDALDDALPLSE